MLKNNRAGFTLLTIVLAMAIIAVVAGIVLFGEKPGKRIGNARDAKRSSDVVAISKALDLYALDNDKLPSDIENVIIDYNEKTVLCSTASQLTCDGQTRDCLVVDDVDFLDKYLVDLPVDPKKTDVSDTGYYITRASNNDAIVIGACESYDSSINIEILAQAVLSDLPVCGNGIVEIGETCDDGNVVREKCGNGILEVGTYCNNDCGSEYVLSEICDYDDPFLWQCTNGVDDYASTTAGAGTLCAQNCQLYLDSCGGSPQN